MDTYSYRAWVEGATPSFVATTFLNDLLPFDHTTRANGLSVPDVQVGVAGPLLGEDGLIQFPEVRGITAITFASQSLCTFNPPGGLQYVLYTINAGVTATATAGTASPTGFTNISFTAAPYVLADAVMVSLRTRVGSLGPGTALSLFDFRYYPVTAAAQATATLTFGGTAALTATAITVTCVCCHYDYGHAPTCPNYTTVGTPASLFTVAGPALGAFTVAAAPPCGGFISLGPACAPFTYNAGREEGCECVTAVPIPPIVYTTAYLSGTGALAFGGSAGLTATDTTPFLDNFLPPGQRVILYVDGVTAKGSMIGGTGTNILNGPSATFHYVGPAGVAQTSYFTAASGGVRPYFGSNQADFSAGQIYANTPAQNNARFELTGATIDHAFTAANSGFTFAVVTIGQTWPLVANSLGDMCGMFAMPSPWGVTNVNSAYMILGQDPDAFLGNVSVVFFGAQGGSSYSWTGPQQPATFAAAYGSPAAPFGPSAWCYGGVVNTTGVTVPLFSFAGSQPTGSAFAFSTSSLLFQSGIPSPAYTAPTMLTFAATSLDFARGARSSSRFGVWLLVEGTMTTAQLQAFCTAAVNGIRMKGATP